MPKALSAVPAIVLACAVTAGAQTRPAIPVEYHKLENGLKVVVSRDTSSPTAVIGVYYNIGFRIEPKERTGFAHLFEHMMFQGSEHLGKNEFIGLVESNGGVLNGSTRFDFTNYFQVVPSHTLETMLWGEADRMRGLAITQDNLTNQQGVVKNEVKVNVLNAPYGGFPWLDVPQIANTNWYNAHNFYGDLEHLDAATLDDVKQFFKTYYSPNNAVLVVTGDVEPAQTLALVKRYFAAIPAAKLPPHAGHLGTAPGEGEARQPGRPARQPSRARRRLPRTRTQHAGVVRDGPDRRNPRAGAGQPALSHHRPFAWAGRRGQRRHQRAAREHVRREGTDPVDGIAHP